MKVIWGTADAALNRALAGWLEHMLGMARPLREPYTTMGVFEGEALIDVLLFENFRPEDGTVEIGGAATSRKWMTRSVMDELAEFVFRGLGCQMGVFRVPASNDHVSRLLKRVGMAFVEIPRLRGRNEPELFFMMTDDAWDQNRLRSRKGEAHA